FVRHHGADSRAPFQPALDGPGEDRPGRELIRRLLQERVAPQGEEQRRLANAWLDEGVLIVQIGLPRPEADVVRPHLPRGGRIGTDAYRAVALVYGIVDGAPHVGAGRVVMRPMILVVVMCLPLSV